MVQLALGSHDAIHRLIHLDRMGPRFVPRGGVRTSRRNRRVLENLLKGALDTRRTNSRDTAGGGNGGHGHGRHHRMLLMAALAESCRTFIRFETVLYSRLS